MEKALIVAWLVKAMASWIPIASHNAAPSRVEERYEQIASDVYDVTMSEAPLFKDDDDRLKTMLQVLSVESFESAFVAKRRGDQGRSFCQLQIMPLRGIILDGDVWHYAEKDNDVDRIRAYTGAWLEENHADCVRVGLHMMRASFRHTGDLGEYTGEGRNGRKAEHRQKRAAWWFTHKRSEL